MKNLSFLLALVLCNNAFAQTNKSLDFDGQNRKYIVFTPSDYSIGKQYPLVFILHGFTQTGSGIMNYSGFNTIAESAKFIAVYPDGINLSWNSTIGQPGVNDIGFINALLDTMIKNYGVNTSRVFSCGFSNGGYLSHRIACELSPRFTAIASVAGTMMDATFNGCNPTKPMPVLQIHGTSDFVVSYNGGPTAGKSVQNVIDFWTNKNSCTATPTTTALPDLVQEGSTVNKIVYNNCTNNNSIEHLKITSGGHSWPSELSLSGIGNVNKDINASKEIWRFFQQVQSPVSIDKINKETIDFTFVGNQLSISNLEVEKINIYNFQGQFVSSASGKNAIDFSSFPKGIYLLQIKNESGEIFSKKIFW
jgi:polyhydroxybutyrate depolymerase